MLNVRRCHFAQNFSLCIFDRHRKGTVSIRVLCQDIDASDVVGKRPGHKADAFFRMVPCRVLRVLDKGLVGNEPNMLVNIGDCVSKLHFLLYLAQKFRQTVIPDDRRHPFELLSF